MKTRTAASYLFPVALASLAFSSCQPERSDVPIVPPAGAMVEGNRQSTLRPGPARFFPEVANRSEVNDADVAQGKQLFNQFNCSGCHAAGGGAIGPALMDDEWIYGSSATNIFWTIIEGRPQGMPAFGGRIAEDQVWRIAGYVRSLSGLDKAGQASEKQSEQDPSKEGKQP